MAKRGTRNTENASLYSNNKDRALRPEEIDAIAKESDRLLTLEKELREREAKLVEDERHVKYCTDLYARLPFEEAELRAREEAFAKLEFAFKLDVAEGNIPTGAECDTALAERLQQALAEEQRFKDEACEVMEQLAGEEKVEAKARDAVKVVKATEAAELALQVKSFMALESEEAEESRELASLRKAHDILCEKLCELQEEKTSDNSKDSSSLDEHQDEQKAFQEAEVQDLVESLWEVESVEEAECRELASLRGEYHELWEQLRVSECSGDRLCSQFAQVKLEAQKETAMRLEKEEKVDECLECLGAMELHVEGMEAELQAANEEAAGLKDFSAERNEAAAELSSSISSRIEEAESLVEKLQANEMKLAQENLELSEGHSTLQGLYTERGLLLEQMESSLPEVNHASNGHAEQIAVIRSEYLEERIQKNQWLEEASGAQSDVQRLRKQRNQLQSDSTRLREQRQQLEEQLQQFGERHAETLEAEQALQAHCFMEKETCVSELQHELSEQHMVHETRCKEFTTLQEEWFREKSRLQEQAERLENDTSRLRENRNKLRDQRAQAAALEKELKNKMDREEITSEALRSELDRAEESVKELMAELKTEADDRPLEPAGGLAIEVDEDDFKLPDINLRSPKSKRKPRVTIASLHRELRLRDKAISDLRRQLYQKNYENRR